MSDDVVEPNEPMGAPGAPLPAPAEQVSRKDRNAARRAEFEAQKAAKDRAKAAAKAAELEERLAAKEAKQEAIAAAKAAKSAKKAAKAADAAEPKPGRAPREEKPAKPEKDPYRPRFAVAPPKVRAFTVLAALFALVHATGAVLLLLETTSSPVLGALPTDMPLLAYAGAAVAFLVAALWTFSAKLLCAGRVSGKTLGVIAIVLGLPLSLIAAPLLFSADVRDWAL